MRTQSWFKNLSFLIAWVFVVNALMPSLVQASVNSFSQTSYLSNSTQELSTKILICTAQGYKWVEISELENEDQTQPIKPHYECPLCYSASHPHAVLIPDAEIRVPLPAFIQKANYRLQLQSKQKQNHFLLTTSKRGPPLFA